MFYSDCMEEVGKRDFLHNTEKHIKDGSFILTRYNIPEFVVTFKTWEEGLAKVKRDVEIKKEMEADELYVQECNCSIKFGDKLCPLHRKK